VITTLILFALPQLSVDWEEGVRNQLLEKVDVLPLSGTPGTLSVFGKTATVILTGGGDVPIPVAAAATYGKGRVFAIAHSGYMGGLTEERVIPKDADGVARLMYNVKRWAGGGLKSPKMVDLSRPIEEWRGTDIFVWRGSVNLSPTEEEELLSRVAAGAGLIMAECPWGWAQVTGKNLQEDMRQNQVLGRCGMVFGGGYNSANQDGGFSVRLNRPRAAHAGNAIEKLKQGQQLSAIENNALERLLGDLSMRNEAMSELRKFFGGLSGKPPTPARPLSALDTESRFWVRMYSRLWSASKPEKITAAPGAAQFPGVADKGAQRISHALDIVKGHDGWYSTGLFLSAGEVLRVEMIGGDASKWRLRIGCHSDRLWGKDKWTRWPEVSHTFSLSDAVEHGVSSPWGGLVYLVPAKGAGNMRLVVSGVVEAPQYRAGDLNSRRDWRRRRMAGAPWGELVGKNIILSLPAAIMRDLDDPESVCAFWDKVMATHCELAAIDVPDRPERLVADQQISAGYMHSGYPIMTWLDVVTPKGDAPAPVLDLKILTSVGNWGYFHELGHNRQRSWWTFGGTGEVTNNLFSLHAGEKMAGIIPWENAWLQGQKKSAAKYLKFGEKFSKWKSKPGIALVTFALLQREFGWEPFTRFFASFENQPASYRPSKNQDKIDQWVLRLSLEVKHDLRPYFQSWDWPISDSVWTDTRLDQLPVWSLPEDWQDAD